MREFGSDFHRIEYPVGTGLPYRIFNHYVSGRQPLLDIVQTLGYRRIWVPGYYCGESLDTLKRLNVEIRRYCCLPTDNPDLAVRTLPFFPDDLLLRVNYFGIHGFHDSSNYCCDVIEDHTHNLIGEWALNSNARWCFASIRKTLPTADGGILWSPVNDVLPHQPKRSSDIASTISLRYSAMATKAEYLNGSIIDKNRFLNDFRFTEDRFGDFSISDWSEVTGDIVRNIDIEVWYSSKKKNLLKLISLLEFRYSQPILNNIDKSTPFSLIILFNSENKKENARSFLIRNNVFPAILWPDVDDKDRIAVDFSKRMLSVHCDGRYSEHDMIVLSQILNRVI